MLSSLQNPLVKNFRKLQKAKERHRQGCFLLEGTHLVEEAIATHWPVDMVCCTPAWQDKYPQLWHTLETSVPRCEQVTDDVMAAIATTVHPDGIVAIAPRRSSSNAIGTVPQFSSTQLGIALETIQDPGNLGTIIRSTAAGGGDGLWLSSNSVDLDHPKVLRASAGQWFRLPMVSTATLADTITQAQVAGLQVVATLPDATLSYWDADLTVPTLILAGNEGAGLSDCLKGLADLAVRIPIAPSVESLNVAIAVSLLIFEANRQRNVKEFSSGESK
jgi:TrmH family RNA methyltransferase